jgi:hypothetical protein
VSFVVSFAGGGLVYDYFVDCSRTFPPEFRAWTEIVPSFTYRKDIPYFQMLVRTAVLDWQYFYNCKKYSVDHHSNYPQLAIIKWQSCGRNL